MQVALVLGTLLLLVNPIVPRLFLSLDPDGTLYLLSWDLVLIVLLVCSVLFVRTRSDRYRRLFFRALLLAAPLLFGSELLLSNWRMRHVDEWHSQKIEGVYEPHVELGWRPIPGARGHHVSAGNFDVTYTIDAVGRREIPPNFEEAPTIHVFGDSYAFGHGVANAETALNLLAGDFAKRRGLNVANYAVMGYGLEQMVTALRIHEARIEPGDYVVFLPMSFDLTRNMIHKRFLCSFPIRDNTPVGGLRMRQNGTWTTVDLDRACGRAENLLLQSNFAFGALYHSLRNRRLHPALSESADAIFDEARETATRAGATFALLFLAAPWECERGDHDFDLSGLRSAHRSMLEHCPDEDLAFPSDSHWSSRGHRWVADFLAAELAHRHTRRVRVVLPGCRLPERNPC